MTTPEIRAAKQETDELSASLLASQERLDKLQLLSDTAFRQMNLPLHKRLTAESQRTRKVMRRQMARLMTANKKLNDLCLKRMVMNHDEIERLLSLRSLGVTSA